MSTHLVSKSRHFHIPYFHHGIHSYDLNAFKSPSTIYNTTCMSTSWASCCQSLSTCTFCKNGPSFLFFKESYSRPTLWLPHHLNNTAWSRNWKDFEQNCLSKLELDDLFFRPSFSHKKRVICYLFYKTCSRQQHRLESPSTKQRKTFESINIKSNTFFFNQNPHRNVLKTKCSSTVQCT